MTFSIVGRCSRTGAFGVAITSSSPAVAARCAYVRSGVGAATTQNVTDPRLGPALLDALSTWSARPETLGGVLLFRDLGLLEERDPEAAATFLDVLRDAREARHAPLRLVRLEGPGRAAT